MKGVRFGVYHSYNDLKLILSKQEIGAPHVKKKEVEIEGADGVLDYTDYFGEPKYGNVKHKFTFSALPTRNEPLEIFSQVKNAMHGKKMRIILDDDPSFYYVGRLDVGSYTNEKGIGTLEIEADCEAWKYKMAETVVTQDVNGTKVITLTNSRKRAVPTITTTATMNIAFENGSRTSGAGTFLLPELELVEGNNHVTVTGVGNITFKWQEAML